MVVDEVGGAFSSAKDLRMTSNNDRMEQSLSLSLHPSLPETADFVRERWWW